MLFHTKSISIRKVGNEYKAYKSIKGQDLIKYPRKSCLFFQNILMSENQQINIFFEEFDEVSL
ncbi:hypothetical protein HNQ88_000382 [Aureibacter tunicatorum]|uniref:Uncharacterized protein n=1 Tax=Aureibacter tunicatorum TaxID=866807 RepID=A0AAE3XKH3_9BACT|nr:hypothetical protein [Aureibacter tunicatorum]BDD06396.1 hypothetical protein AUTU_38790 [Aureibacter tunicatorum]